MLGKYWLPITVISLLVIFGQIIFASLGVLLSGQPLKTAMQTGFTLVQVGEFSFILAIPTMLAAAAYSLLKARNELSLEGIGQIGIGFVTAFVVALVTVRAVLAVIGRIGFTPFGWYRIAIGTIMLAALSLG